MGNIQALTVSWYSVLGEQADMLGFEFSVNEESTHFVLSAIDGSGVVERFGSLKEVSVFLAVELKELTT